MTRYTPPEKASARSDAGGRGADHTMEEVMASSCQNYSMHVPGGYAAITEYRLPSGARVLGWVEDDDANGGCAKVEVLFDTGQYNSSRWACHEGDRAVFSFWGPGAVSALVHLRAV